MRDDEFEAILLAYRQCVGDHVDDLTRLDRQVGDGDFGDNLLEGLNLLVDRLPSTPPGGAMAAAAEVFLDAVGGTSGPLFGLFFSQIDAASKPGSEGLEHWRRGVTDALEAIQRVGEAQHGDCTLIDALLPAARALSQAKATMTDAARAATAGARETSELRAKSGRASYVGEHAIGVPDPGAVAIAMFFHVSAQILEPLKKRGDTATALQSMLHS